MSTETVTSWMERINKLIEGYSLENIWNMDKSGCFLKLYWTKGYLRKENNQRVTKNRNTVLFLLMQFKKLQDLSHPGNVHYFSNHKSWIKSEVMEAVLARFNRKLVFENRKVILFLDNAMCHPESMIGQFLQIKINFLPQNTNLRLQPLDVGIIQNFKVKYRKRLVK